MRNCAGCGIQEVKLYRCLGCMFVTYCGERCQNIDRESHKSNCRALARAFRQASEAKRSMWWALDTFWTSYDDLFARLALHVMGALDNPDALQRGCVQVDLAYDSTPRSRRDRFQVICIVPRAVPVPVSADRLDCVSVTVVAVDSRTQEYVRSCTQYHDLLGDELRVMRHEAGNDSARRRVWKENRKTMLSHTLYHINYRPPRN